MDALLIKNASLQLARSFDPFASDQTVPDSSPRGDANRQRLECTYSHELMRLKCRVSLRGEDLQKRRSHLLYY